MLLCYCASGSDFLVFNLIKKAVETETLLITSASVGQLHCSNRWMHVNISVTLTPQSKKKSDMEGKDWRTKLNNVYTLHGNKKVEFYHDTGPLNKHNIQFDRKTKATRQQIKSIN